MIRMRPPRFVCTTASNLCLAEWPSVTHRGSRIECSGSSIVTESRSPKIVVASSKETPCFRRLLRLFSLSHSKSKPLLTHTPAQPAFYGISIRWPFQLGGRSCRNWDRHRRGLSPPFSAGASPLPKQKRPAPSRGLAACRNHQKSSCPLFFFSELRYKASPETAEPVPSQKQRASPLTRTGPFVRFSTAQVDRLKSVG